MRTKIVNQSILNFSGDVLITNLFEGVKIPGGATGAVDKAMGGAISRSIKKGEITGKIGEALVLHTLGKIKADKVIVVGLGRPEKFNLEAIRKASGAAARQAAKVNARTAGTIVHGAGIGGIAPEMAAQALAEGTFLALYQFDKYKKPAEGKVEEFHILEIDKEKIRKFTRGFELGKILAEAQNVARDLTNEPANTLNPEKFNVRVKGLIKKYRLEKTIKYQCLGRKEMARLKMGALLSVSQGSENEPKYIVLRIKRAKSPVICLIGKTVTFDSGGISLKPANSMFPMKGDMAGGAAVIGATLALARTGLPINLISIIPAVENMPSGKASRPGDVVRAMNGKSIEIVTTDAEGRMTLADAICYAEREGAKIIVDIATLTGACQMAFGELTAAIMGNDQRLTNSLLAVGNDTGERMWAMPLFEEYKEQTKSNIADIKNSGGRDSAIITAGIFLEFFVSSSRWLHLDIAGKEITEKEKFYQPKGATGYGVRSLFEFCRRLI